MRMTLIVGLSAAGIGLAGTSGASAAPVNGAVIGDLAIATDHVTPVQWGHWRWVAAAVIGDGAAADGGGGRPPNLEALIAGYGRLWEIIAIDVTEERR